MPESNWQEGGIAAELRDILAHLKRRRRPILLVAFLFACLGAVAAGLLPRLYTATTQIMVDPRGLRVFDNEVVPSGQVSDVQSTIVETQAKVLKSDAVLKPVVDQEKLVSDPEFNGEPRSAIGAVVRAVRSLVSSRADDDPRARALANLDEATKVQRLLGSFVLEVSVKSEDAEKAARLARAITAAFIASQAKVRQDAVKTVSDGLAMRLDELSAQVNRAEKAVDDFKRQNNIIGLGGIGANGASGQLLNEQQLSNLTTQLANARIRTGETKARYDQIQDIQKRGGMPDATAEAVQSPTITQLRASYAQSKQAEDSLLATLGPRHPALIAAHAQLQGVQRLIADEIGRLAVTARTDYERARTNEADIARQVDAVTRQTDTVNTATIRLRELEREAQARRAVYESFLTRSRETREQGDLPQTNIATIAQAAVPTTKSGLPAILVIAIAAAFGASAGSIGVLAHDRFKGRLMTPRQLGVATGLPLLGIVHAVAAGGVPGRTGLSSFRTTAETAHLRDLVGDLLPADGAVALFVSGPDAAQTALPLELARSFADEGAQVLVMDADSDAMTAPIMAGPEGDPRLRGGVRATALPGVSILPCTAPAAKPLATETLPAAARLRITEGYAPVLIHASVDGASMRLRGLAATSEAVILLIHADHASEAAIDAIRQEIGPHAGKVGGFVWLVGRRDNPKRRSFAMGSASRASRPGGSDTAVREKVRTDAA